MEIKEYSPIGKEVAESQQALIVGISINNSYFKTENLEKILIWASSLSRPVYVMIPDEPAVYTLMALGKTKEESERIARLKSNALENKCRDIEQRLAIPGMKIIRWKDITGDKNYQTALSDIQVAYSNDESFRNALNETTASVMQNGGSQTPSVESIGIGVQFLFQELAFIVRSSLILRESKTAYLYHRTMDVLKNIIDNRYSFQGAPNVGFITAE